MNLRQIATNNKLRLPTLLVAATMLATIIMPTSYVLAEEITASTDNNTNVTTSEVAEALRDTSGILAASDQTKTTTDADSAIQAVTAGASVDIPKDASDGVTLGSADGTRPAIDISLPNAENAGDAKQVAPGTVAYPANDGSANAVQATEDGGVRMLTVIDNPSALTSYDYKVTVPGGGRIEITELGGAVVLNAANEVVAMVDAPWAKDANGTPVKTYFTTDGLTLTQHIEHNVPGIAYPVTADPFWDPVVNLLKNVWKGALGCVGGRELVHKGVRYFVSKGGTWLVMSKLGMRWVPVIGWVSCGYGAWEGIRY